MTISVLLSQLDREVASKRLSPRDCIPASANQLLLDLVGQEIRNFLGSELDEFYRIQDGESINSESLIFGQTSGRIYSILEAMAERRRGLNYLSRVRNASFCHQFEAIGAVTEEVWGTGWLPLMLRDVLWICDFEPESGGAIGQIIVCDPENQRNTVKADSLSELIAKQVQVVKRGRMEIEDFNEIQGATKTPSF